MRRINSLANKDRLLQLIASVSSVAESGIYTEGAQTFKLEKALSEICGGKAAVALNSRGSALLTMFKFYKTLGHKHIAIQNNCFAAVGSMALQAGFTVYLVDSSEHCPAMSIDSLAQVMSTRPWISLVVINHIGGWMAKDYLEIDDYCHSHNALLLEDCSSVLGLKEAGFEPGMSSDAAIWSFQQTSVAPVGGGALITTHNLELRDFARQYRSYGKTVTGNGVFYGEGEDLRMSEWEAAIALLQLSALPEILRAREEDHKSLSQVAPCLLKGKNNYSTYPVEPMYANSRYTMPSTYALTEQLTYCLPKSGVVLAVNLVHSSRWAASHKNLPIGEGLYSSLTEKQIIQALTKPTVIQSKHLILPKK